MPSGISRRRKSPINVQSSFAVASFFRWRLHGRSVALQLYNVRTKQNGEFTPLDPAGKKVGIYVCGLTVYDHMHIGHARTAVSFEVIRRWLEHHYEDVTFSQNVTDVDDKIIARAAELGVSPRDHAASWDKECAKQSARLGVRPPDLSPHATTSMDGIVRFIKGIVDNGFAYGTEDGNVYFDVPKYDVYAQENFPEHGYGSLSRRDFREMAAGTRKAVESDKQHPADFALWKAAKSDEPDGAQWESPWGKGRPGWHIECSYMSTDTLGGDQIDIHGGGQDLIFPHHENEMAQSQARTGKAPFVNVWMHAGFLNVEGVKMSKSLGNFITLKESLDELESAGTDPAVLRFYFIQNHYRSKVDFVRKGLAEATIAVQRLERTRQRLSALAGKQSLGCADIDPPLLEAVKESHENFQAAMDDDIHTPGAIAAIFDVQKAANTALDGPPESPLGSDAAAKTLALFETMGQMLTLFDQPVPQRDGPSAEVQALAEHREAARQAKDWSTADRLRDEITAAGWFVQDTPNGPGLEKR
jgi:cysteinyl-tRNA synthetase